MVIVSLAAAREIGEAAVVNHDEQKVRARGGFHRGAPFGGGRGHKSFLRKNTRLNPSLYLGRAVRFVSVVDSPARNPCPTSVVVRRWLRSVSPARSLRIGQSGLLLPLHLSASS